MFYNFYHTSLILPLLNLYFSILSFWCYCECIIFLILFWSVQCQYIEVLLIFVSWSYIMWPYWTCLLILVVFLVDLLGFSKYKILLSANGGNFSLSNLDAFYFSFLPDCTDLTSIQKSQEQISSLFPASGKAFHHSPLRCGCRGFVGDFYWVEKVPFFLLCQEFLSWMKSESENHSLMSDSLGSHGILQARMLEWVVPFSRGSSQPRDQTQVSRITGRFFTSWAARETQEYWSG